MGKIVENEESFIRERSYAQRLDVLDYLCVHSISILCQTILIDSVRCCVETISDSDVSSVEADWMKNFD